MGNGASVAAGLEVSEEWQALHKPTRKKVENLLRNQQQKIEQLSGQVLESLAKTPSKQVRDSRVPHLQKKLAERNAELKALRAALENPNKNRPATIQKKDWSAMDEAARARAAALEIYRAQDAEDPDGKQRAIRSCAAAIAFGGNIMGDNPAIKKGVPDEMISARVQAIRDAITVKNQTLQQNEAQLLEAEKNTASRDARKRIRAEIEHMQATIANTRKVLPELQKHFHFERLHAIQNLAPDLRHAFQQYNQGFKVLENEELNDDLTVLLDKLAGLCPKSASKQSLQKATHLKFGIPIHTGDPNDHRPIRRNALFLVGLKYECAQLLPKFHAAVESLVARVNMAHGGARVCTIKYAPLKGDTRCHSKAMEKYYRRYDLIKDIARLTVVVHPHKYPEGLSQMKPLLALCQKLISATENFPPPNAGSPSNHPLSDLANHVVPKLRITRVKNRLRPDFDSVAAGGYRDILLNCKLQGSNIVCEIQLNLEKFLEIKDRIGHKSYKMARQLNAFDHTTTCYAGAFSKTAVDLVGIGAVTKLTTPGSCAPLDVKEFGMESSFMKQMCIKLGKALQDPRCRLTELDLGRCQCLKGIELENIFPINSSISYFLHILRIEGCGLTGSLEPLAQLTALKVLNICKNDFTGDFAPLLALTRLVRCKAHSTKLCGDLDSFGHFQKLRVLNLWRTHAVGNLSGLSTCTDLEQLYVNETQLEGTTAHLNGLDKLERVTVADTKITVVKGLPKLHSLAQGQAFTELHGDTMRVTVKDFVGATVGDIDIKCSATVNELKDAICRANGAPAKEQILFHHIINEMKGTSALEAFTRTIEHTEPKSTQVLAPKTITMLLRSQWKRETQ